MNFPEEPSHAVADSAIDRLVCGELSEADRRELLLRLENDPDGWRRCALAFLEDQAWRSAIAGAARSIEQPGPTASSRSPRRPRLASIRRLAVAAILLVATFAAGLATGGAARNRGLAELAPTLVVSTPKPAKAAEPDSGSIREVGWINVVDPMSGESPPQRVPIFSGPGLDDLWLRKQGPAVPDYVRAQWERQGYQVEEHRSLVSVVLEDGRRVSIPVDEVALEYVGQKTF